ncbi:acetyl-CoA carboxylase biotin carboxyl carrier protein [candidate division KSB1 bacterium]|nr:MAG: acetyl-CoA carboxylase biotin carboxyl carrier protein [candidate division KSB1 bacterium]
MATTRPKVDKSRFDLHEIKKLIELIERSPITEFELVEKDLRVRISKNGSAPVHGREPSVVPAMVAPIAAPLPAAAAAPVETAPPAEPKRQLYELKSPMVGTFYRAPSPDADPYVRVGDVVEPGKVLCIVEAMKLMNELESEVRGRIVEILIDNAQPVEFGQILFRIDTTAS